MKIRKSAVVGLLATIVLTLAGCQSNKANNGASGGENAQTLHEAVQETIDIAKTRDPSLARWFDTAHGYAVFPGIGAGGFIIGGGHGSGEVYSGGRMIGTAKVTQLNIGATVGGQVTQQLIFFKDKFALESFTKSSFEFDAAASAVAIKSGIAATSDYNNGVAVFVMPKKGAMVQASLGTQKFAFTPN
jgi:lipid-binding SYLF domain-containing protein